MTSDLERGFASRRRCRAVDGLVVGGREVWVVVARAGEEIEDLLWAQDDPAQRASLRICRAVLEGGILVVGNASPERDPLLSELMGEGAVARI